MTDSTSGAAGVAETIRETLDELELTWSQTGEGLFSVQLPGSHKLFTECALEVGRHTLSVRAFVCRRPDENQAGVFNWLLQHNMKLVGMAFALDVLGDIYLIGRVPLAEVTADTVDRLLAVTATTADDSFNTIVELGFSTSIRKEWEWRLSRGESTKNLAAFAHLAPDRPS